MSEFTADNMKPHVGTTFHLAAPDGRNHELKLVDVKKVVDKHTDSRFRRDTFSLLFLGPLEPYLPQATYPMSHDDLGGPHAIFIVPTARERDGYKYEAVFT